MTQASPSVTEDETFSLSSKRNVNSETSDFLQKSHIVREPDHWLARVVDFACRFCSSILIKETRQAIKSRQFLLTYLALLVVCAFWAIAGLALNIQRSEVGPEILMGYFFIMGVPLGVIVPFSAYRSLTREFEDGTIQLVSITTMRPWQIVAGKLGSAMLQMMVYLSVLAPCIAFTYLLRGIGMNQIVIGVLICVAGSLCLTVVGLFLAGATRSGALNIGMSVLFVVALAGIYLLWIQIASGLTSGQIISSDGYWEDEAMVAWFSLFALFGSTSLLLFLSAAAQISFPSENRSTATRIMMLVQQVLFFASIIAILLANGTNQSYEDEMSMVIGFCYGHYWLLMGFLMLGEAFPLSQRVRRALPTTMLGKSFGSLLMPGPGRGFLFSVANVLACSIAGCLIFLTLFSDVSSATMFTGILAAPTNFVNDRVLEGCYVLLSTWVYISWFLAVIYLLMVFRRRWLNVQVSQINSIVALIAGVILVVGCCLGGYALQINLIDHDDYTMMQMFNWHWTIAEMADQSTATAFAASTFFTLIAFPVIALAVVVASRELLVEPASTPERVIQDQKLHAPQLPPGESIDEIFAGKDYEDNGSS